MKFDIRHNHGHYELFVNDDFYGSYDTVSEASQEIDRIQEENGHF